MKRFVETLVLLCGVAAVLALSLLWPRPLLTSAVFTAALLAILAGVVAAIVVRGERAVFWRAFALFGAVYLLLAVSWEDLPKGTARYGPPVYSEVHGPRRHLATSYLLAWIYDVSHGEHIYTSGGTRVPAAFLLGVSPSDIPEYLATTSLQQFLIAGHSVLAILVAWLGGTATAWLTRRCALQGSDVVNAAG